VPHREPEAPADGTLQAPDAIPACPDSDDAYTLYIPHSMSSEALLQRTADSESEEPRVELALVDEDESRRIAVGRVERDGAIAAPRLLRGLEREDWSRLRNALDAGAKRMLDIAVSATLLLLLLPVIVAAVVLIRLDSPGPAFFRSTRAGFRGRQLRMLKFRKMHDGASGPALTMDDDNRFTRVGGWLAKTKIDEIPQLWHVLRGEMSLVGPRPEDPRFVADHAEDFDAILRVRPGITGYSQIAFAEESRILDDDDPLTHYLDRLLPQKLGMDRMYAENRTLLVDLRVLFWTLAAVVMRKQVAVHRDSGRMNLRSR
jgi:lipopolysaccharide/colanic/teichoic acid biosynthesis glycosyltransferase